MWGLGYLLSLGSHFALKRETVRISETSTVQLIFTRCLASKRHERLENVKLPLFLAKHHAIKTYGEVES
jgi:hypothetical protein